MRLPLKKLPASRQTNPSVRRSGIKKLAGKGVALTATALLSLAAGAHAQNTLFTVTGGTGASQTQTVAAYLQSGGNWYHGTPAQAPVIGGTNALISSSVGPYAFGNSSSSIPASPGSGGNKVILPGNKATSSFTLSNLNLAQVSNPEVRFNLILLGGNGNPTLTVQFAGSFGTSSVPLPVLATNSWTEISVPVPANVLGATGPVSLTFQRNGNTNGANGAHFWAIDDVAITSGAPTGVAPCPVAVANTYSWNGAGSGSGSTNTDFDNLANWCPQPATVSALGAGTLQLHLTSPATLTLDANFTATAIEASIAGNDNSFVLNLNGHNLNVTGNLTANATSGNANTHLEIRTGAGALTVNGTSLIGAGGTGKVGFGATAGAGALTFNGPVTFGPAAAVFASAPKTITLKNTLTNNSATLAASGFAGSTLVFSGVTAQTISGTQDLQAGNLTVNNPAGVNSTAINLLVPGTLTLTNGLLTTAPQAKVKLGTTGSLSEKANAYVVGYVEAANRAISAGTQNFGGLGLTITAGSGPYATTVNRITSLFNFTIQHGNSQNYVEKQTIKRKYQISVANAPADLDARLTLYYWSHELAGIATEDLGLYRENPSAPGTWTSRGRDANALTLPSANQPGSITLSNIAAFSTWSAAGGSTPLPVELMWFTAKNRNNAAVLEWATAVEDKNAGFQIEASNDNLNFETIGFIDAQATRNHTTEYSFTEPQQAHRRGLRYYRITQHDTNGTKTVLGVRSVQFEAQEVTVITSPNPFTHGFSALIEANKAQTAQISLIDALGREVSQQITRLEKGLNQIDFSGTGLDRGMYVLRIQLGTEILTTKVNKQ